MTEISTLLEEVVNHPPLSESGRALPLSKIKCQSQHRPTHLLASTLFVYRTFPIAVPC